MLSFRKKILISDLILFLIFIALLFPFVGKTVGNIVKKSLEERATLLIDEIKTADSEEEMVDRLKASQLFIFFRFSLLDSEGRVLYESHAGQLLKEQFSSDYITLHPEVQEALKHGVGYSEGYSKLFGQTFAYMAKSFEFQGQKYVIRTAFPFQEVEELTNDFEIGFLSLGAIILVLYSLMTWIIIHRLSSPIQEIINAVKPYQEGKLETLPKIELKRSFDSEDDFTKLANTLNSLSERIQKQIETVIYQRNENESILDSLVEGVLAFNAEHVVTYANSMACKLLGVPKDDILGSTLAQLKPKTPTSNKLIEKCKELLALSEEKTEIFRESIVFGDAAKSHWDIIAVPRLFKTGAILVFQDKSADFRVLEMGKDFIANASHELRTPITIIRGFAETLQDLPELTPTMLKEITEKIVRTCDRLNNLVKNILLLADIENVVSSRFIECDLGELVEYCKHSLLAVHKAEIKIIQKKEGISILGDADLLQLAILNILENAVKYSTGLPHITITLDQKGSDVQLSIEDKGIGIPEPDLVHIFERFYTVDKARSRRHGGAGLGLSIVKTIIEKHHGTITAASKMGQGSKFTIHFHSYEKRK